MQFSITQVYHLELKFCWDDIFDNAMKHQTTFVHALARKNLIRLSYGGFLIFIQGYFHLFKVYFGVLLTGH